MKKIQRLFPPPFQELPLKGLYLEEPLYEQGSPDKPFVYANFLTSLDGRIALDDVKTGKPSLPKCMTSPEDFRLFLELHAQAECLVTHGGYLRSLAEGRLGNILQVGVSSGTQDLLDWRRRHGLKPQPAIVVASASLDFPMPDSIEQHGQTCFIATGKKANPERVAYWRNRGIKVIIAGNGEWVEGESLLRALCQIGYRRFYLIAGPQLLDTVIRSGLLSRMYQTITHRLMGGEAFRSLLSGPELGRVGQLRLRSLYYDPVSFNGSGQWFAQFESIATQSPM